MSDLKVTNELIQKIIIAEYFFPNEIISFIK